MSNDVTSYAGAPLALAPAGATLPDELLDNPTGEIRRGVYIALAFFVGFLGWAALAHLDAAAYAPGQLIVSGQRQAVQHRDGGVVEAILVKDGERVRKGQILIRLAGAEARADERALAGRSISLMAQQARLRAELMGRPITWPAEFAALEGEDRQMADEAMALQNRQYSARRSLLAAQRSVLGQQSAQANQQGQGYGKMVASSKEQARLVDEELESLRGVAEKGFVSKNRLRALEREKADLEGRSGQYSAGIAQSREAATQGRMQVVEAERTRFEQSTEELRQVEDALSEVEPKWRAARDRLSRIDIRAPSEGTVVGLKVHTVGGVVGAGELLMSVVPDNQPMIIEARVSPNDADDLKTGQPAQVRFSSIHDPAPPTLDGTLTMLSADRLSDERTGDSYYRAEVTVPRSELAELARGNAKEVALRAGTPVEVLIPLQKRTALQYALEPLKNAMWRSFREH